MRIALLLIVASFSVWLIWELLAESQGANTAFFCFVVTGYGNGMMDGYFGYPCARGEFWSRLYIEVLPSADIGNISLLAKASGYETTLIAEPPDTSPYPPSVTIKNHVVLYPFVVPIDFTITVLENGYLTVAVSSDYYLREVWMRNVFKKMLKDINLPPSIITRFDLPENRRTYAF